jgi:hypothetical protein
MFPLSTGFGLLSVALPLFSLTDRQTYVRVYLFDWRQGHNLLKVIAWMCCISLEWQVVSER